jgi:hypothetical protein
MLALALLVVAGIGVTRLWRRPLHRSPAFDAFLTTGAPFVLCGALLGPGLGVFDPTAMRLLAPVVALGIGWIGATFGARLEWRMLRRISIRTWLVGAALAVPVILATTVTAWELGRVVRPLGNAWGTPLLPAALLLAGAATTAASWPGPKLGRRNALLDTAFGTAVAAIAVALYSPHVAIRSVVLTIVVGGGLGALFVALARSLGQLNDVGMGVLLFGVILACTGFSYATRLSPFVVCTVMTAVIVRVSPASIRQAVQSLLRGWEISLYAAFLIVAGALLRPSTAWLLAAAVLLAVVRVIVRRATVRFGVDQVDPVWRSLPYPKPPEFSFPVLRQGPAAVALAAGFDLVRGDSGAMLTTVLLSVLAVEAIVALTPLTASARRAEVT